MSEVTSLYEQVKKKTKRNNNDILTILIDTEAERPLRPTDQLISVRVAVF